MNKKHLLMFLLMFFAVLSLAVVSAEDNQTDSVKAVDVEDISPSGDAQSSSKDESSMNAKIIVDVYQDEDEYVFVDGQVDIPDYDGNYTSYVTAQSNKWSYLESDALPDITDGTFTLLFTEDDLPDNINNIKISYSDILDGYNLTTYSILTLNVTHIDTAFTLNNYSITKENTSITKARNTTTKEKSVLYPYLLDDYPAIYEPEDEVNIQLEAYSSRGRIIHPEKGYYYVISDKYIVSDYDYDREEDIYYIQADDKQYSLYDETALEKYSLTKINASQNDEIIYSYPIPSNTSSGDYLLFAVYMHPDYKSDFTQIDYTVTQSLQNIKIENIRYDDDTKKLYVKAYIQDHNKENIQEIIQIEYKVNAQSTIITTVEDGIIDETIDLEDMNTLPHALEIIANNTITNQMATKYITDIEGSQPTEENYQTTFITENAYELNTALENLETISTKCNATIYIKENIDEFEGFYWNNPLVNLTINSISDENTYIAGQYFLIIGENTTVNINSLTLSRLGDSSLIENNGQLNICNVRFTAPEIDSDMEEDEEYTSQTPEYGVNIYNRNIVNIWNSYMECYGYDDGNGIYNEKQCNIYNTTIIDESDATSSIISVQTDEEENPRLNIENSTLTNVAITGINDTINDSEITGFFTTSSEHITISNSSFQDSDIEFMASNIKLTKNTFTESQNILINAGNMIVEKNTFSNCIFEENQIVADTIIIDSNIFNNTEDIPEENTEVELISSNATLNNNTFINFSFNVKNDTDEEYGDEDYEDEDYDEDIEDEDYEDEDYEDEYMGDEDIEDETDIIYEDADITDEEEDIRTYHNFATVSGKTISMPEMNAVTIQSKEFSLATNSMDSISEPTENTTSYDNTTNKNSTNTSHKKITRKTKQYKAAKIQTQRKNRQITLKYLNKLFNKNFSNKKLLIYIDGILLYNSTTTDDLDEILIYLTQIATGKHTIKVIEDGKNIYTKTTIIT